MTTPPYEPRTYRTRMARPGLMGFRVAVKETDLWVLAARDFSAEVREIVIQERQQLEAYIAGQSRLSHDSYPLARGPVRPAGGPGDDRGGGRHRGGSHGRGGRGFGGPGGAAVGPFEPRGHRGKWRRHLSGHCTIRPPWPCLPGNPL